MKTNLKEMRDRNTEELRKEIDEKRRHLFDLRSQAVTEKLEDPSQLKKTRKDIARILTILREREISGNGSGNGAGSEEQPKTKIASKTRVRRKTTTTRKKTAAKTKTKPKPKTAARKKTTKRKKTATAQKA